MLSEPGRTVPMVILINKFSASASEIVAAALQDHGRAVVVGERSYGKGSVQNIILMEKDTSALKLTTASYWRPSGKNIHRFPDSKETDEWGVRPSDSGYRLTPSAREALGKAGVAEAVLAKLKDFPDKRFPTEKAYLDELTKCLGEQDLGKYRAQLLAQADRGFEVPMTDEERLEYMLYRSDRDVVRNKPKPVAKQPEKKDGKPKKPFTDRVLEKAVDHLKKEIDKGAAAALPVPHNA
jgi:hypothetical protein